ncbi:hypothetical protein [Lysinibacillus sphaericus]|nr:hypothetical protein [Lysinibacillus sp. SDF0037]
MEYQWFAVRNFFISSSGSAAAFVTNNGILANIQFVEGDSMLEIE